MTSIGARSPAEELKALEALNLRQRSEILRLMIEIEKLKRKERSLGSEGHIEETKLLSKI